METSAWLSASKNVEKLVSCLLGSGEIVLNSIKIEIPRDRQFCHCGNVEPPLEFVRGWDMCGTSCPPTPMSPPPYLGIVENCGTSLHTMVSFRSLEKVNGVFGFWRENLRMDPLIFHSSSEKPMAAGESLAGRLR